MGRLVNYTFWKWDGVLSQEFCHSMLEQLDWATSTPGSINAVNPVTDPSYRRVDIIPQNAMQPLGCIARTYIEVANQSAGWGFNLSGQEDTQLIRYKSIDEGFYDWHMDSFPPVDGLQRKLSCVILLNDPSEYEGGLLQFKKDELDYKDGEAPVLFEKQGSIIVFPSFLEHRVTPVTKGVRYTAVTWANGPSFK